MIPNDVIQMMDAKRALFGLFFAFHNRLQAAGDSFYEEITCKQFFLLACMCLFPDEAPTPKDLAQVMGSSHQNVKQILNKLEHKGFIQIMTDQKDKRKLRIYLTPKAEKMAVYNEKEEQFMEHLFQGINENQIKDTFAVIAQMEQNLIQMKGKKE